ncbi:unnamed protein product [Diabrotica balteata]|uniref:Uncharacterized protein n=1 Tax=Diabrotica balteata TaxID=107213 RepID=A0A9N9XEK1_DIABA|nr:unnamed protein product [Diabrotica balteata]
MVVSFNLVQTVLKPCPQISFSRSWSRLLYLSPLDLLISFLYSFCIRFILFILSYSSFCAMPDYRVLNIKLVILIFLQAARIRNAEDLLNQFLMFLSRVVLLRPGLYVCLSCLVLLNGVYCTYLKDTYHDQNIADGEF